MKKYFDIFKNKWVKFGIVSVLYILFVIWLGSFLWILGLAVIYDIYISKKVKWAFWKDKNGEAKGLRGWVDSIICAVVAVTLIRIFFIEAYTIPTGSMEKSLLIGDYLFVDKITYGPRIPNTPLSFPLVHNILPFTQITKSYLEWIKWDYKRLAGLRKVKRDDVVVFNFPHGDTVLIADPTKDFYEWRRSPYGENAKLDKNAYVVRPVDKKDNYVKRCIAIPGDTLKIIDGDVYVNGEKQKNIPKKQYRYRILTDGRDIPNRIWEDMDISASDRRNSFGGITLTDENFEKIKNMPNVVNIERVKSNPDPQAKTFFPFDKRYNWDVDNYGPIWIPQKGVTIELTIDNLPFYKRIIDIYENNDLVVKDDEIFINGEKTNQYTFKMDYYWMMGDNRHNSLDSRYWGYVPEDHIVGKPAFIWFSSDPEKSFPQNIRWNRLFSGIK
ncbi:MAG: signal peptidase I [Prevotellaceae bacterium]|jgi:signal peptidase I|nr:signal peptidase I [Prevotellaceae bacterium]